MVDFKGLAEVQQEQKSSNKLILEVNMVEIFKGVFTFESCLKEPKVN